MKNTGIVRRIDELGRIVLPKELRRTLGLREGDPLMMAVEDGQVIMKRYSTLENQNRLIGTLLDAMAGNFGLSVAVTDDRCIVAATRDFTWIKGYIVSGDLRYTIQSGVVYRQSEDNGTALVSKVCPSFMAPIAVNGRPIGGVFIIGHTADDEEKLLNEQVATLAADMLSNYLQALDF